MATFLHLVNKTVMPLPSSPLTFYGGCSCRSVRYKICIPKFSERPLNTYCDQSHKKDDKRFPAVILDHCNDCRRATGSVVNAWFCVPTDYIFGACISRSAVPPSTRKQVEESPETYPAEEDKDMAWIPGNDIFKPGTEANKDTFLAFYASSKGRNRSFCGKCGTNLMYMGDTLPEGFPDMMDIILGTVDTKDLDGEALKPEAHLYWDCGVPWLRDLAFEGSKELPRHPLWKMNEIIE